MAAESGADGLLGRGFSFQVKPREGGTVPGLQCREPSACLFLDEPSMWPVVRRSHKVPDPRAICVAGQALRTPALSNHPNGVEPKIRSVRHVAEAADPHEFVRPGARFHDFANLLAISAHDRRR